VKTRISIGLAAVALMVAISTPAEAQRRMGGGPMGGGQKARMDAITDAFKLDKDQRKAIKTLIDDAYKAAAPIRAELTKARMALVTAITTGKPQADIDAAAQAYGAQSAALADAEMKALAGLIGALNEEQAKNNAAISGTFFLMRSAFVDDKKWDDIPDPMQSY
jgi:hypothetical protein